MYAFVIADKNTGEIISCGMDELDGGFWKKLITEQGISPVTMENNWEEQFFCAEFNDADFPKGVEFGSKNFRELFKVFPIGESNGKDKLTKARIERRAVRARINEIDGRMVSDPTKYAAAVALSKSKQVEYLGGIQNVTKV